MAKLEGNKLAMPYVLAITCYPWSLLTMLLLLPKKYIRIEPSPNLLWVSHLEAKVNLWRPSIKCTTLKKKYQKQLYHKQL